MKALSSIVCMVALLHAPGLAAVSDDDADELQCVLSGISPDGRSQIYESWHNSAPQAESEAMFENLVVPSLTRCIEIYGWNADSGPFAALSGIVGAIKSELDRRFPLTDAELEIVERAVADVPYEDTIAAVRSGRYWALGRQQSTNLLQSTGLSAERASDLSVVGHFDVRLRMAGLRAAFASAKSLEP